MNAGKSTVLRELCSSPEALTMDQVLQAQEAGDREVNEVIEDVLDYLGIALANTINTISPRMVLLDGHMLQSQRNQALILRAVERNMFRVHADKIQFTFLPYSPDAGARGAAAVVARECLLNSDL